MVYVEVLCGAVLRYTAPPACHQGHNEHSESGQKDRVFGVCCIEWCWSESSQLLPYQQVLAVRRNVFEEGA